MCLQHCLLKKELLLIGFREDFKMCIYHNFAATINVHRRQGNLKMDNHLSSQVFRVVKSKDSNTLQYSEVVLNLLSELWWHLIKFTLPTTGRCNSHNWQLATCDNWLYVNGDALKIYSTDQISYEVFRGLILNIFYKARRVQFRYEACLESSHWEMWNRNRTIYQSTKNFILNKVECEEQQAKLPFNFYSMWSQSLFKR